MKSYGLRIQNITYAVILLMQNTDPLQKDLQTVHFIHIFLWHSIGGLTYDRIHIFVCDG